MKKVLIIVVIGLLISCSSSKKNSIKIENIATQDSTVVEKPVLQQNIDVRASIKDNNTIIGAVVDSVQIIDSLQFKITVYLQTAITTTSQEGLLEPGQSITVYPAYFIDEEGNINTNNEINSKIFGLRTLVRRGYFIGNISLAADGKFYITSVEAFSNPPEGINNEF